MPWQGITSSLLAVWAKGSFNSFQTLSQTDNIKSMWGGVRQARTAGGLGKGMGRETFVEKTTDVLIGGTFPYNVYSCVQKCFTWKT